jgi:hypothetical protein
MRALSPGTGVRASGEIVTLTPEIRYAQSGSVQLAYRIVGTGAIDMVLALGFVTHLDVFWDYPPFLRLVDRLASFRVSSCLIAVV